MMTNPDVVFATDTRHGLLAWSGWEQEDARAVLRDLGWEWKEELHALVPPDDLPEPMPESERWRSCTCMGIVRDTRWGRTARCGCPSTARSRCSRMCLKTGSEVRAVLASGRRERMVAVGVGRVPAASAPGRTRSPAGDARTLPQQRGRPSARLRVSARAVARTSLRTAGLRSAGPGFQPPARLWSRRPRPAAAGRAPSPRSRLRWRRTDGRAGGRTPVPGR